MPSGIEPRTSSGASSDRETLVWLAGVGWDAVPGTDHRIVAELTNRYQIVWVDPLGRRDASGWWRKRPPAVEQVDEAVVRLRSPALRGAARWPIILLSRAMQSATVRRNTGPITAVVAANPMCRFPAALPGVRVLYATDDWISGAPLMGLSTAGVTRELTANVRAADVIATVTSSLLDVLLDLGARDAVLSAVIPNGASSILPTTVRRQPMAGLVGHINERLDLSCLEAIVDAGIPLKLIGPRSDRDPQFGARLERLLRRQEVEWTDRVEYAEVVQWLSRIGVGVTPYANSTFNACSFPLKTLEYLAGGAAVVSTDLPAARWLDCADITIAEHGRAFGVAVRDRVDCLAWEDGRHETRRREFAARHSWANRAADLSALIDAVRAAPTGRVS